MTISTAAIQTENASRYLQQLCKHFGHKIPAEFTAEHGTLAFPFGLVTLDADSAALRLKIESEAADATRAQDVVASHLKRFAFREELDVAWAMN